MPAGVQDRRGQLMTEEVSVHDEDTAGEDSGMPGDQAGDQGLLAGAAGVHRRAQHRPAGPRGHQHRPCLRERATAVAGARGPELFPVGVGGRQVDLEPVDRTQLLAAPQPRGDLHPWLQVLVWQLLEKDPARRPADALETYDRLLPYVEPPGPLGDIDPAGSGSGMQLYSRLLVRLCGTEPRLSRPPSPPPIAREPTAQRAARRSAGWTLEHSLWVLPTLLFGMGTWLSFGYIAARHQRRSWLATGAAYLVLAVTAFALIASGPESGTGPGSGQSIAGLVIGLV